LDVARLGNIRYHGGVKGYYPLTIAIVHRCGYTALNSTDVTLNYNDIIRIHNTVWETWEHPRGNYKGPQLDKILEKGLASFPWLSTRDVEASVTSMTRSTRLLCYISCQWFLLTVLVSRWALKPSAPRAWGSPSMLQLRG